MIRPFSAARSWGPMILGALVLSACEPTADAPQEGAAMDSGEYSVVHGWPVLPNHYRQGRASGLAVNSRNEVVNFHRADRSWLSEEGPISRPVLSFFDAATGELLRECGEGMFTNPHGLGIDDEDNLWVADSNLHQVMKLSPDCEVLMVLGEAGVRGDDGSHFSGVTDVAVAPDGSVFVSDGYGNNRVAKFDAQGNFLLDWGGERSSEPGMFDLPHGITVDDEGRVYVADRSNSRVQVFDGEGSLLAVWDNWAGQGPDDLGRPWGLEYHDGHIYVADGGEYWLASQFLSDEPDTLPLDRAQVQRLDLDGNVVEAWGGYGFQDGEMVWPHDVTVDHDGGVYTGEVHLGMRIQKWARGGGNLNR